MREKRLDVKNDRKATGLQHRTAMARDRDYWSAFDYDAITTDRLQSDAISNTPLFVVYE